VGEGEHRGFSRRPRTVFGESAGAISACIHLVSPGSQGLAHRFILQSGTCVGPPSVVASREHAYAVGSDLVSTFCPQLGAGSVAGDPLACLRAADPTRLMEWLPPLNAGPTVFDAARFFPIVDGPGGVLPDTPENLIAGGHFDSKAAIVAGTNKNDWGIFFDLATNPALGGSIASPLDITAAAEFDRAIDAAFGSIAAQVKAQYPVASDADAQETFVTLWTDYAFRCPTRQLARATTAHGTRSFFLYSYEVGRAYHSDELLALFDVPGLAFFGGTIPSPTFQSDMKGYWTEFAATGRLDGVGGAPAWPSYDATTDRFFVLQDPTSSVSADLGRPRCDFWDRVFASGGE
jgi:para-nitrobenzyl esterase